MNFESPMNNLLNQSVQSTDKILTKYNDLVDDNILTNFKLEFQNKMIDEYDRHDEMTTKGLWRIESNNFLEGGFLKWAEPLRLRHLTLGKYLKVKRTGNANVLDFSGEMSDDGLFYFQPIRDEESKSYITSENYFRIQSNTKEWLSIKKSDEQHELIRKKFKNRNLVDIESLSAKEPVLDSKCLFY